MDLITAFVLFIGAIGTVALLGWDTFQNRKPIKKLKCSNLLGLDQPRIWHKEKACLTEVNYGRNSNLFINSWDFNLLFVLIIFETYLLYEIGRAILENSDDDDMIIRAAEEHRPKFYKIPFKFNDY